MGPGQPAKQEYRLQCSHFARVDADRKKRRDHADVGGETGDLVVAVTDSIADAIADMA